jgi:hypothetical protein
MISGYVNTDREAIIQLVVLGENKQNKGIKAVVDTGYTGFLTLPSVRVRISYCHDKFQPILSTNLYLSIDNLNGENL